MQTRRSLTVMHGRSLDHRSSLPPHLCSPAQIGVQRERNVPNGIRNHECADRSGSPGLTIEKANDRHSQRRDCRRWCDRHATPGDARIVDGTDSRCIRASSTRTPVSDIRRRRRTAALRGPLVSGRSGRTPVAAARRSRALRAGRAPNSLQPIGLQPELAAVDLVKPEPDAFSGPQSAGITAALTAPASGIFRGLSAVINLGGSNAQAMIVKAPIAEHIGFTPSRGGGYPNSLLGVFSALRQQLLDAQHYGAEQAAYRKESARHASPWRLTRRSRRCSRCWLKQIPVVMEAVAPAA